MKSFPDAALLDRQIVSTHQVNYIVQGARRKGYDIPALLDRAGIHPGLLESPQPRVSQAQCARLLLVLTRTLRDELWGLCNHPLPPGSLATACRLAVAQPTLGEALRAGFRFFHQVLSDFTPRVRVVNGRARCQVVSRTPDDPCLHYAKRVFIYYSYGFACWLVERRFPLDHVSYTGQWSRSPTDIIKLFQAPLVDNAWMGYAFDADWLSLPVVQTPRSLEHYLRRTPATILVSYRDTSTYSERVKRFLRKDLSGEVSTLQAAAASFNLTPQTLRRRLKAEGQGFQEIKNELRRDLAIQMLGETVLSLNEIANRLGFTELPTFHRAFREWTGSSPGVYRQNVRRVGSIHEP
ncbi:MAG: AraC family transcriptional regulator [Alcaligenaceae bacterium]|nr:AraC family transcriptional regulator [Alcaligenaceae bacterium]